MAKTKTDQPTTAAVSAEVTASVVTRSQIAEGLGMRNYELTKRLNGTQRLRHNHITSLAQWAESKAEEFSSRAQRLKSMAADLEGK